jgi:hypothetical protein
MKTRKFPFIMIISMLLVSQSFSSCIYRIKGNGKVIKSERQVSNFNSISVSNGIDLILSQDSAEKVMVEADENLQKIIKTEVSNGKLKIYTIESVFFPSSMKVYVTLIKINSLESSSGADVESRSTLSLKDFKISASSGSDIKLALSSQDLRAESSSGSDIVLSGKTEQLNIHTSSGADVNAEKLNSEICSVEASSGADAIVSVSRKIEAHASSGSDIRVNGNPAERDIHKSSGGSVSFK